MSSAPIVKNVSWLSIIPQIIVMILLIWVWSKVSDTFAPFLGALTYLIISISLRTFLSKDHRKGMNDVISGNFEKAIPYFEKSYDYFKRNEWIDKYRFITLFSTSKTSFTEMALNNIAFCYGQMGNGLKSKEYYERTLTEFPDSGMAKAALNLLNSMNKKEG